ncbi:MAG TPA: DNA polymerase/3'-5' exonuclease PolX [Candidatus Binataceae bacterium]|nr:DNA polymerase/3'-5' exonuclease PolX [Candidatus Binataceae bacterium]
MRNDEIASVFDEIADMLELGGENFFRVRAYRNAARTVRDYPEQVAALSREKLDEIPGIGADLADKIATLAATGDLPLRAELKGSFPAGLLDLRNVGGLGPKRIRLLAERLHIRNREDLRRAAEAGQLRTIRGFGPKLEERIVKSLVHTVEEAAHRMQYAEAALTANDLIAHLRGCAQVKRVEVAGSFRRRRDTVGDLDVLVAASEAEPSIRRFLEFPGVTNKLGAGETKATVVIGDKLQVDLRVVPRASWGAALVYFTGSKAHGVHIRRIAQTHGLLLNEYGLFRGERAIAGAEEGDIYEALGMDWVPPELREDRGEVEAALEHRLPALLQRSDLRGDLHTHSTWTDGRATIREMARRAAASGLEYFAITDHSQRLTMVHGLDSERLREQAREIEAVGAKVSGIKVLRGIEVDILEDGTLDLPDGVLEELDWVVASVHSKLEQETSAMTRRLVRAIRNPNVDVIGHPSGRLIGRREASGFDLREVLRAAHEEGCALEVNAQPDRLDLIDTACMAAKRAGVKVVISSDAHHPHDFAALEYGVNQARRGWIEPSDVLNTRPLNELRQRGSRL